MCIIKPAMAVGDRSFIPLGQLWNTVNKRKESTRNVILPERGGAWDVIY